jgi:hypothetical protein
MPPIPPTGARGSPFLAILAILALLLAVPRVAQAQQEGADSGPPLSGDTPFDRELRWPLNDLGKQTYLGEQGGLYPGGENLPPDAHEQLGIALAALVVPRDARGAAKSSGVIGFAAVGFSLARIDWNAFEALVPQKTRIAGAVRLANLAANHQDIEELADPGSNYWTKYVPYLLQSAGLTAAQIEVIWMLEGDRTLGTDFPRDARRAEDFLRRDVAVVHSFFPNARLLYVSSSAYCGFAADPADDEPVVYDNAFAFKWLIGRQIAGDPALNCDPNAGPVRAPWLSWGPFLWSDGALPRGDGWNWRRRDVLEDGVHPSRHGARRVAQRLWHWFVSDPTATPWFCKKRHGHTGVQVFVERFGAGTTGTQGEPRLSISAPPRIPTNSPLHLAIDRGRPGAAALFVLGEHRSDFGFPFGGLRLWVEPGELHAGTLDSRGHGELAIGMVPDDPTLAGLERYAQAIVADPLGPDGKFALSAGLRLRMGD